MKIKMGCHWWNLLLLEGIVVIIFCSDVKLLLEKAETPINPDFLKTIRRTIKALVNLLLLFVSFCFCKGMDKYTSTSLLIWYHLVEKAKVPKANLNFRVCRWCSCNGGVSIDVICDCHKR